MMVSFSQDRVLASLAQPPQRSRTVSPSTVAQTLAPTSSPDARLASNTPRTGANLSWVKPSTAPAVIGVLLAGVQI